MRLGVLRISEGGWDDLAEPNKPGTLCKYGDCNNLTLDIGTSKLAQGNCGHTVVGDVQPYNGEPPPVTVFNAPKERMITCGYRKFRPLGVNVRIG